MTTLSCFLAFHQQAGAQTIPDDEGDEIVITGTEVIPESGPKRSSILVPITAYYYSSMTCVGVDFLDSIGTVTIRLTNLLTGSVTTTVIDSVLGSAIIPITTGYGAYSIEFQTLDNSSFLGFFYVY